MSIWLWLIIIAAILFFVWLIIAGRKEAKQLSTKK